MKTGIRIGLLSLSIIVLSRLQSDEAKPQFTTTRAKEAQKAFEKTQERLRTEYEGKRDRARAEYAKTLQGALADAKKAKNKQEIEAIEKTIAELGSAKSGGKPTKIATKPEKLGEYTFTGGNGESIADAVVIGGAEDSAGAVDAQGIWLKKHYPKHRKEAQALFRENGKTYDRIEIVGPDGQTKNIHFDITTCFGLLKSQRPTETNAATPRLLFREDDVIELIDGEQVARRSLDDSGAPSMETLSRVMTKVKQMRDDIDINAGSRLVPPVDGDADDWWHWEPDHSANGR